MSDDALERLQVHMLNDIDAPGRPQWAGKVDLPDQYRRRTAYIPYGKRATTLRQINDFAKFMELVLESGEVVDRRSDRPYEWRSLTMTQAHSVFVKPITKVYQCSFMELVATGALKLPWVLLVLTLLTNFFSLHDCHNIDLNTRILISTDTRRSSSCVVPRACLELTPLRDGPSHLPRMLPPSCPPTSMHTYHRGPPAVTAVHLLWAQQCAALAPHPHPHPHGPSSVLH